MAVSGGIFVWAAGPTLLTPPAQVAVRAAFLVIWLVAVWKLTEAHDVPQAVAHGFSTRSRLRRTARWLQAGWAVAAIAEALVLVGLPGAAFVAPPVMIAGYIAGAIGTAALAAFLSRLAYWIGDDLASKSFSTALWGIPMGLLVIAYLSPVLGGLFGNLILLTLIGLLLAVLLAFPLGLMLLSRSMDWSVVHARHARDRECDLRERVAGRPPPPPRPAEPAGPIPLAENGPDEAANPTSGRPRAG